MLQVGDRLGPDRHAVHRVVWVSRVTTDSVDGDPELVRGRVHRADPDADLPDVQLRVQVRPYDHVDSAHDARTDQLLGPAGSELLGVLEDEAHPAGDLCAQLGQDPGRAQQHGGVAVVAARVHNPRRLGGEVELVLLHDRQGVHVGPKGNPGAGQAAHQVGHHTGLGGSGYLQFPELVQPFDHELGGLVLLERQLRVPVHVPAPPDHVLSDGGHVSFEVILSGTHP